ncbi:MAG TPA: type II secretion system protein [Coriobacteriia bacterium]|nr:type II secretion system protein [Coriobacteriia bacterium]
MPNEPKALCSEAGFTIIELAIVVAIMAVLLLIAIPRFLGTQSKAAASACFENQRTIEGAVTAWLAQDSTRTKADLEGVLTSGNPLVDSGQFSRPPRCPASPDPADPSAPTVAEGAYTMDDGGNVEPCNYKGLGHGHY